jgi:hypothetical protein
MAGKSNEQKPDDKRVTQVAHPADDTARDPNEVEPQDQMEPVEGTPEGTPTGTGTKTDKLTTLPTV